MSAPTNPYPNPYNPATGPKNTKRAAVWHKPEEFAEHRCNSCGTEYPVADLSWHHVNVSTGKMFDTNRLFQLRVCKLCYDALFPWTV